MQKLRSIHLYLGCICAPILLLFAISGICQTLGLHLLDLGWMTGIHKTIINKSTAFKSSTELSRFMLCIFVGIMTLSFIFSTILGVVMALKYGRSRRAVFYCLLFGVFFPLVLYFLPYIK